jgi:hypothetical protein
MDELLPCLTQALMSVGDDAAVVTLTTFLVQNKY